MFAGVMWTRSANAAATQADADIAIFFEEAAKQMAADADMPSLIEGKKK